MRQDLAAMESQPFLASPAVWIEVKDGNASARALFHRHYSYRPYADGRDPALFVGPGEKMVLLTPCVRALLVWRKFKSLDRQEGVNCSVFRNEGAGQSSKLIREAMVLAWERWPDERLFTYVNPRKVKSRNPGYCFLAAGWRRCGVTKHRRLLILDVSPDPGGRGSSRETEAGGSDRGIALEAVDQARGEAGTGTAATAGRRPGGC
jgi:hypothetical protein